MSYKIAWLVRTILRLPCTPKPPPAHTPPPQELEKEEEILADNEGGAGRKAKHMRAVTEHVAEDCIEIIDIKRKSPPKEKKKGKRRGSE